MKFWLYLCHLNKYRRNINKSFIYLKIQRCINYLLEVKNIWFTCLTAEPPLIPRFHSFVNVQWKKKKRVVCWLVFFLISTLVGYLMTNIYI